MAELTKELRDPNVNFLRAQRGVGSNLSAVGNAVAQPVADAVTAVKTFKETNALRNQLEGLEKGGAVAPLGDGNFRLFEDQDESTTKVGRYREGNSPVDPDDYGVNDFEKRHLGTFQEKMLKLQRIAESNPSASDQYSVRAKALLKAAINKSPGIAPLLKRTASSVLGVDFDAEAKAVQQQREDAIASAKEKIEAIDKDAVASFGFPPGFVETAEGQAKYLSLSNTKMELEGLKQALELRGQQYKANNVLGDEALKDSDRNTKFATNTDTREKALIDTKFRRKYGNLEAEIGHQIKKNNLHKSNMAVIKANMEARKAEEDVKGDPVVRQIWATSNKVRQVVNASATSALQRGLAGFGITSESSPEDIDNAIAGLSPEDRALFKNHITSAMDNSNAELISSFRGAMKSTDWATYKDNALSGYSQILSAIDTDTKLSRLTESSDTLDAIIKADFQAHPGYSELKMNENFMKALGPIKLDSGQEFGFIKRQLEIAGFLKNKNGDTDPTSLGTGASFNPGALSPKEMQNTLKLIFGAEEASAGKGDEQSAEMFSNLASALGDPNKAVSKRSMEAFIQGLNTPSATHSIRSIIARNSGIKAQVASALTKHLTQTAMVATKAIKETTDEGMLSKIASAIMPGEGIRDDAIKVVFQDGALVFSPDTNIPVPEKGDLFNPATVLKARQAVASKMNSTFAKPMNDAISAYNKVGINPEAYVQSALANTPWANEKVKGLEKKGTPEGAFPSSNNYLNKISGIESNFNTSLQRPGSKYIGKYQFSKGSASPLLKKAGKNWSDYVDEVEGSRSDPSAPTPIQDAVFRSSIEKNGKQLEKLGIPVTEVTTYLAHQQGVEGLRRLVVAAGGNENKLSKKEIKTMYKHIKSNLPKDVEQTPASFLQYWKEKIEDA